MFYDFGYFDFTKSLSITTETSIDRYSLAQNIRQLSFLVHNDNLFNITIPQVLKRDTSRDHSQPNTDPVVNSQYIDKFVK